MDEANGRAVFAAQQHHVDQRRAKTQGDGGGQGRQLLVFDAGTCTHGPCLFGSVGNATISAVVGMQLYKPAAFAAVQEERGKLMGMIAYLKDENERLAALDRANEQDIVTYDASRGLRGGFQVPCAPLP